MVSCFLSDKKGFCCFCQFYSRKSCREMLRRIEPEQNICYNIIPIHVRQAIDVHTRRVDGAGAPEPIVQGKIIRHH